MFQFPLFQNFLLDSIQIFLSLDSKSFKNSSNLKFHDIKSTDSQQTIKELAYHVASTNPLPCIPREDVFWEESGKNSTGSSSRIRIARRNNLVFY